jgi:hypothetical protein
MIKFDTKIIVFVIAIILIVMRVVGFIDFAFFGIMTAMFLVLGGVLLVFFLGSESESTGTGAILLISGFIMLAVLVLVEPVMAL